MNGIVDIIPLKCGGRYLLDTFTSADSSVKIAFSGRTKISHWRYEKLIDVNFYDHEGQITLCCHSGDIVTVDNRDSALFDLYVRQGEPK